MVQLIRSPTSSLRRRSTRDLACRTAARHPEIGRNVCRCLPFNRRAPECLPGPVLELAANQFHRPVVQAADFAVCLFRGRLGQGLQAQLRVRSRPGPAAVGRGGGDSRVPYCGQCLGASPEKCRRDAPVGSSGGWRLRPERRPGSHRRCRSRPRRHGGASAARGGRTGATTGARRLALGCGAVPATKARSDTWQTRSPSEFLSHSRDIIGAEGTADIANALRQS